jgi:3-oxoacyl-[acyl-carrier protein] reductase
MTQTIIAFGPSDELAQELADGLGDVVVIECQAAETDIDAPDWLDRVDDAMWRVLVALQAAHSSMAGQGGRIALIVPMIGMAGAAGLTAYTTAIEGIRAMAKSAARQWRSDNVVVNMVAAPLRLFTPGLDAEAHLTAAALQGDATLVRSVVESARFLLRPDLDHLVGETLIVDGGAVMLP